mmetsp:Transcript_31946/g.87975  ORF Transcript_31946/g.87975 Transcript_31946/m.87975 type:complete len:238 (-) Transcript_31946:222-935(-)
MPLARARLVRDSCHQVRTGSCSAGHAAGAACERVLSGATLQATAASLAAGASGDASPLPHVAWSTPSLPRTASETLAAAARKALLRHSHACLLRLWACSSAGPAAAAPPMPPAPRGCSPSPRGAAKTRSRSSAPAPSLPSSTGRCPTPGGRGGGGAWPSARARRFSRYHWAARVLYFWRMGRSSATPCDRRKSANLWFPPSSIIRRCTGRHESMLVDCTKLTLTPKLRCTPAAPMLR